MERALHHGCNNNSSYYYVLMTTVFACLKYYCSLNLTRARHCLSHQTKRFCLLNIQLLYKIFLTKEKKVDNSFDYSLIEISYLSPLKVEEN